MKKYSIAGIGLLCILVIIGCEPKVEVDDPTTNTSEPVDVPTTDPDTIPAASFTDSLSVVWEGSTATVSGNVQGVTVTSNSNGYLVITSTVKDVKYLLSGSGTGQFKLYSDYKYELILNGLTLACSDGAAINSQSKKKGYVLINGTNSLSDGSSYAASTEDQKAAFFSEGQLVLSGAGSLNITGNYKHAIASDDYIEFAKDLGTLTLKSASDGIHANDHLTFRGGTIAITAGSDGIQCDSTITVYGGTITITADGDGMQSDTSYIAIAGGCITVTKAGDKGITAFGDVIITDGTIRVTSQYKCIKAGKKDDSGKVVSAGNLSISGGDIQVICTGTSTSSGGGPGGRGGSSSDSSTPEGIEAKGTITISGGNVYAQSSDDAINAGGDMTISGGCVCAYSTGNDGLDANGNCYIKGGLIYAIGSRSPEMAIDANTEGGKKLYVTGGTIVAVGSLESGAQLSQTCYSASGSASTWYALVVGDDVFAFKTPSSNAGTLVVSGASKPSLYKSVTPSGTAIFNNMAYYPASYSGGSSVSLSTYSAGSGGGPGGGGGRPGW